MDYNQGVRGADYVCSRKKICEELGISVDDLAKWCHTGELIAYNENHQPILTPRQCKSKFKYQDNSIFNLELMGIQGIIAINKKTIHNFEIFIEDDYGRNNEKKILQTSHKNYRGCPS